jgi:hypothetical protein
LPSTGGWHLLLKTFVAKKPRNTKSELALAREQAGGRNVTIGGWHLLWFCGYGVGKKVRSQESADVPPTGGWHLLLKTKSELALAREQAGGT